MAPAPQLSAHLSPVAVEGLATLAARTSAPAILFGALFIPNANAVLDEGLAPGRSDLAYRWAHDETQVTFKVLIDGQWRTLVEGTRGADNLVRGGKGEVFARVVSGPDRRESLVAEVGVLESAAAAAGAKTHSTRDDHEPKLCPDNDLAWWVNPENDPRKQMDRQSRAASAAGRLVVWHAQTQRGFQG